MQLTNEQIKFFHDNGYLLVKGLFSKEEVEKFRLGCIADEPGDVVGRENFDYVTLDPRVVGVMKQLADAEVVYPGLGLSRGNDPVHSYARGARVFHTDAPNDDYDFSRDYPIYNSGIYLQDHAKHSGGLKIKPGSHKYKCLICYDLKQYVRRIISALKHRNFKDLKLLLTPHGTVNVPTEVGDFLVFKTRTHHSGHAVRLKLFPNFSLPPLLEKFIPAFMARPVEKARCVILTIYTKESPYLEGYIANQIKKNSRRDHYLNSPLERPDVIEISKNVGVTLRNDGFYFHRRSLDQTPEARA